MVEPGGVWVPKYRNYVVTFFMKNVFEQNMVLHLIISFDSIFWSDIIVDLLFQPKCKKQNNKLGLSWAKLSYQLGFACTLTIICSIVLMDTE